MCVGVWLGSFEVLERREGRGEGVGEGEGE